MKIHKGEIPIIDKLAPFQQIESLKAQVLEICESVKEIPEAMRSVFRRYRQPHQLSRFMNHWGVVSGKVRREMLRREQIAQEAAKAVSNLAAIEAAPIPYSGQIDLFVMASSR